jgi:hypothetical protein
MRTVTAAPDFRASSCSYTRPGIRHWAGVRSHSAMSSSRNPGAVFDVLRGIRHRQQKNRHRFEVLDVVRDVSHPTSCLYDMPQLGRLPHQSRILRATLVLTRSRSSSPRPARMVRIAYSENPFTCSAVIVGGMVSS